MSWQERYAASLMNTFGAPRAVLVRGEGAHVWDDDGREYVDLLGGIAVNSLGHAHPAVVEAVTTQLQTLGHVSNFFATEPQVLLAERLTGLLLGQSSQGRSSGGRSSEVETTPVQGRSSEVETTPVQGRSSAVETTPVQGRSSAVETTASSAKVFLSNSGAEANEAALKLTRRTGRTEVVAATGSFHGRTMGALSLTSKEAYRTPFEPLPGPVTFVPYGDAAALAAAVTERTAAVVLEPIQGEAGVVVPPAGYLAAARRTTTAAGALLWLDEVQTGIGRTGRWFAHAAVPELLASPPDVVTLAKGLGGGLPIGATLATGAAADLLEPGQHGTTFGGNPVACAAALAVLDTIERDGLLEHVEATGKRLADALTGPEVVEVRGAGLMIGADLDGVGAPAVVESAREAGFILNATGPHTLRLVPPLVLPDDDVDAFAAAWPAIVAAARQGAR